MLGLTAVLAVLVLWRHQGNIRRLWRGTEGRIGEKTRQAHSS
jgi:glycerol-3-phosphate acyltransferase PlsY